MWSDLIRFGNSNHPTLRHEDNKTNQIATYALNVFVLMVVETIRKLETEKR